MSYASHIRRHTPREGESYTPLQRFSGVLDATTSLNHFHTFGCPVYNLDPTLQSQNSQRNKWMERSRLGIYLGVSNEHASTVSLLLTPRTGLVSPQFHVKWDDKFETVTNNPLMKEVGRWQEMTQIHKTRRTREPSKRTRRISVTTTDDLKQQSHNNNERRATSEGDNERNANKSNLIQGDEHSI